MKLALPAGSTSQIVHVFIQDSAVTTGEGKTALAFGDITAYYVRAGGALTALTLETIASLGTWASTGDNKLGFKLLHDTNAPGLYELDLPNNILVAGASQVVLQLRATGAAPCLLEIQLAAVPADLVSAHGSGLTEVGGHGRLAAALSTFGDVATPVLTAACLNQTGDSFLRLGAPADTSVSHDIANLAAGVGTITPTTDASDSFSQAAGSVISGTYVNTQTDDGVNHVLAPANPGGLDVTYVFVCGVGRAPIAVTINGYWSGSGQTCDVYAYDYDLAVWDKLTNSSTRLSSRNAEMNYSYPLNREHMDGITDPGNVSIRFVSVSTTTANRLFIDRVLVATVGDITGGTGNAGSVTPQQIWEYVTRTLTSSTGEAATAQDIADAVLDEEQGTHTGLLAVALPAITAKLPTNYLMGSSDVDNHDTDIDAIKVETDKIHHRGGPWR